MRQLRLYGHALRVARREQLVRRALRPLTRRRFPPARASVLIPVVQAADLWRSPAFRHADVVAGDGEVDVLGLRVPFPPRSWSLPGEPRLRAFHLHYGEEVLGWARRGDVEQARTAVGAWLVGNPASRSDAWHPYTISQRVGNWIAAVTLVPELGTAEVAASVSAQARYLARNVEEDVLGNHVIANARALVLAGRALEDRELLTQGIRLLKREVPEQVLSDGGHYERSPLYHLLVLRDLLEARAAADLDWADGAIERMRGFAAALQRPDGLPAPFNDAPLELAPQLDLPEPAQGTTVFEETGYVVVRDEGLWLAFDCGAPSPPFLPPHAHADALSLQLWHGNHAVVVDPGTFTYEPGRDREWFRSTRAHATATIDGREQFVAWGAFRSGPLPSVRLLDADPIRAEARYDGVVHARTLELRRGDLVVHDEGNGLVEARLPLPQRREIEGVERWEPGRWSERMYEQEPTAVAVATGPGAVTVRIPAAATL